MPTDDTSPDARTPSSPAPDSGASRDGAAGDGNGAAAKANGSPSPTRRASDPGAGARTAPSRPTDHTLYLFLHAAERGAHTGLTVTVDGAVITGTLVGTVDYCRALADQFASMEGGTVMDEVFAEAFRTLIDDAYGIAQGDRRSTPDASAFEQAVSFLHLLEARYVSGPTFLPHGRHGVPWRCRVCDVTSWSLGDLTRS